MTDPTAPALPAPEHDDFSRLDDLPVRLTAVVGRARIPIGDLLRADPGAVLELDRRSGDPVDLFVNDRLIGRGEIVTVGDRLAIAVTELATENA